MAIALTLLGLVMALVGGFMIAWGLHDIADTLMRYRDD